MPKFLWFSFIALFCLIRTSPAEDKARIKFPPDATVVLALAAEGVQIYEAKSDPVHGLQWALKAPEAELRNLAGELIVKHFAGPSWRANDGSEIIGALPPLTTSPAGRNIPWLVVSVKSNSGSGLLQNIGYVARIATDGGAAPPEPPKNQTDIARIRYRAIYLFFQKV
jgi:uncharacterized protein DUF3455